MGDPYTTSARIGRKNSTGYGCGSKRRGSGRFAVCVPAAIPAAILGIAALLACVAASQVRADGNSRIIYPPNKTSVDLATITIFGVVPDADHLPRITLNRGGIIPRMNENGTFSQSLLLRRGINVIKIDRGRYYVSFVRPGQKPPKGYVPRTLHPPVEDDCTNCHDFPADSPDGLLSDGNELCLECHDDPASGVKFSHGALEEGCTACHDPHVWERGLVTRKALPVLCYECHDRESGKHVHDPVQGGECDSCHDPHGADNRALLNLGGDALCLECHDDPIEGRGNVHPALEEGCSACHDPHSSDHGKLLVESVNKICFECHDDVSAGTATRGRGEGAKGRMGAWEHGGKGERNAPPTLVIPEITAWCGIVRNPA